MTTCLRFHRGIGYPLPAYDPEGITRGLEKIANEVIDRL